jgi:hypothetical protein
MTQDQYGQAREPGYVGDDVARGDDTEEFPADQAKPMTRFQKVASALRGGGAERDEQDKAAGPDAAVGPYAPAGLDEVAAGTAGHAATEPDMFGTAGNGATPETQARAATIADVPAAGVPAGAVPAQGVPTEDATAGSGLRPGQATLGDFSDLTYGNLIPDAVHYTEQWQQIQFKFVDDPQASVTEAADIIAQVTAKMEAAIQERQRAIEERQRAIAEQQRSLRGRWGEGANADTEALRETLRMYKTFLDQLIGASAS